MSKWLAFVLASILLALGSGCANVDQAKEKAKDEGAVRASLEETISTELSAAWVEETGDPCELTDVIDGDSLSESHAVMAAFILQQRGMDPDLSSYEEVYLVEFTDGDGVERAAVRVDGKLVLPGGAGQ